MPTVHATMTLADVLLPFGLVAALVAVCVVAMVLATIAGLAFAAIPVWLWRTIKEGR